MCHRTLPHYDDIISSAPAHGHLYPSSSSLLLIPCACSSLRRQSSQLDLPLRTPNSRHSSLGRYEPYSSTRRKAKELATPGSLNLMNQPALTANKLSRQRAVPQYTTPMTSPGLLPSLSPTVHGKVGVVSSATSAGMSLPLPSINLNSVPTTTSSSGGMDSN